MDRINETHAKSLLPRQNFPTYKEFGPGGCQVWVAVMYDRIIATQMPLPRQHFPTYEEYGPGWGHVWVDVQNIKNLAPDGVTYG